MSKKRKDKKGIEEILVNLDDKIGILQEPVHRFFEAIHELMNKTKGTNNLDLLKFKLEISNLMEHFSNEMVFVHDKLLEDFEELEESIREDK